MDILIKNIGGLPKDDNLTLTITPKGEIILGRSIFTYTLGEEVRAITLPEHGRIVDADKLKYDAETCRETTDAFIELIDKAPTILEANNG